MDDPMANDGRARSTASASKQMTRARILDAVQDLIESRGWSKASLGAVATAAGVSRQTIYNEFANRDGLAMAYVLREADRFLSGVEAAIESAAPDGPLAALAAGFAVFLEGSAGHPILRASVTGEEADGLLVFLASPDASPLLEYSVTRLRTSLCGYWPALGADDNPLPELLVRLALSHATMPAVDPAATVRNVVELVGPYVESTLDGEPGR